MEKTKEAKKKVKEVVEKQERVPEKTTAEPSAEKGKEKEVAVVQDTYGRVKELPGYFELRPFEMNTLTAESTIVFIGKRRTGKSIGVKNVAKHLKDQVAHCIVISQTEKVNGFYEEFIPNTFIYSKYDPYILWKLFKYQEDRMRLKESGKIKEVEYVLLILDDLISDPRLRNDEMLIKAFVEGRHFRIVVLMTTQYPKAINPRVRGNIDFAVLFRNISAKQREALWEDYGGCVEKKTFEKLMDDATDEFGCMVVDNRTNSKRPEEVFFKHLFDFPVEDFHIGTKEEWKEAKRKEEERRED